MFQEDEIRLSPKLLYKTQTVAEMTQMTTYFIFNKTLDIFPINCSHSKLFIRIGYILYVQCVSSVNDRILRTISRVR